VNYYRRIVKKAAEHHLMIDYHGAYKPDGMRRTWPNLLTREGVMGAEYNKWSGRITADHNLMLAFTRMLAGPMDYTPGGFNNVTREEFEPRMTKPEVQTTRAHALALYAIFESPFQMVADYPEAYKDQKDFEFIKAAPTVWDETRVIGGKPGEYIAVARRRGREWFVGAITGAQPREIDLPMEFLGRGAFTADIYADAADAAANPKHTAIERARVDATTLLHVKMAPSGGEAIRIRPTQ
jgi:alpha-glucosidase